MGSRRPFGSFWAAPKGPQPVKSVNHNTGHSFLGIMNKVMNDLIGILNKATLKISKKY
jgi:hypothetical protein